MESVGLEVKLRVREVLVLRPSHVIQSTPQQLQQHPILTHTRPGKLILVPLSSLAIKRCMFDEGQRHLAAHVFSFVSKRAMTIC